MAEYEAQGDAPKSEEEEILKEAREELKRCIEEEDWLRALMRDDERFADLDQWPDDIRKEREGDLENGPRPCLTIDKLNQYLVQVVNDMRQGKPGINVRPQDDAADVETAKVLKGIIRNIEDQSNADIAYATGGESAAKIGLGYWRVLTEYVDAESDDQEIFIRPIANTFNVYLGKHMMPDGSDARCGFIMEAVPEDRFKEMYPGKKFARADFDTLGEMNVYWRVGETVTVVEYYWLKETRDTLYVLADGTTMLKSAYDKWPDEAGEKPTITKDRPTTTKQLKWVKMTGLQILDERDLPGKYIPIIECVGRCAYDSEGRRILWGLVRPAKDSLRMYNYFASTITEKMGLAPKTPFIMAKGQLEGVEDKWRKANRVNYAYLEYNPIEVGGNQAPAPQRVGPTPVEAALLQQMQVIEHDVQTSLGMFKAAVGETESQQSGRAILALQRESDTGTYHFGANQGLSIRHTGRIVLDMIPHYYDTRRVLRILGEDGEIQSAQIDPDQEESHRKVQTAQGVKSIYNPSVGKYDVAITVGPSYNTKRMEAAATLTEVVKSQPQLLPLIGDLLFRSLDFPYSDQIAERLKKMLPPQLQQGANPAAMVQELQGKMQQMGEQMNELQQENLQLKAGAQEGMAKVQVSAQEGQAKIAIAQQESQAEFALQKQKMEAELALQQEKQNREAQLAREKAEAEIALKERIAEAELRIKNAERLAEEEHCRRQLEFDISQAAKKSAEARPN